MTRSTTSPHFEHHEHLDTQDLHSDLVAESIEIHGVDMFYMPRRRVALDDIYYEDTQSTFDTAYQIPMYIKSSDGFIGSDALMSQFGIEVRLQLILTVARIHFDLNVAEVEDGIYRPREGDLIHIPGYENYTYEIKYVDLHPQFFQHGSVPMYDITIEVFEYGSEVFDTGIEAVDCMADKTSINVYDWAVLTELRQALMTESGYIMTTEGFREGQESFGVIDTNDEFVEEAGTPTTNTVINWSDQNPWGEGIF